MLEPRIIDAILGVFAPLPDETVAEWCHRSILFPDGQGAEGNMHPNWDLTPDIPFILEMVKNPEVREIDLAFAAQSGKTLFLICAVAWMMKHAPGNTLWVFPDEKLLVRLMRERVRKVFELSDVGLQTGKSDKKKNYLRFEHAYLYAGIASSSRDLSSDPMKVVIIDEEDENPEFASGAASPTKLASERMRTHRAHSKFIRACTPRRLDRGIWPAYKASRMHSLRVGCPRCGEMIKLTFENIRWPRGEDGHSLDAEKIKTEHLAWYECDKCKGRIEDHERAEMFTTMEWVCDTPDRPISRVGFTKSVLYSPFEDFSSIAAEFLVSKNNPAELTNFQHSWLAEPKEVFSKTIKDEELQRLCGTFAQLEIPEEVQALTIGADVMAREVYYNLLGWGGHGELFVIQPGKILCDNPVQGLDRLAQAVANFQFSGLGAESAHVIGGAVDARFETKAVYDFCRCNPAWRPLMGHSSRLQAPWTISIADPKRRMGESARGLKLYSFDDGYWQDTLQGYLERGEGAGAGFIHLPHDVPKDFFKHLGNEVKRVVSNKVTNRTEEKWVIRFQGAAQHWRDCLKLSLIIGHVLNLHRLAPKILSDNYAEQKPANQQTRKTPSRRLAMGRAPLSNRL